MGLFLIAGGCFSGRLIKSALSHSEFIADLSANKGDGEKNMMLVPTYLAPSNIHGTGLFAQLPIERGTEVWKYNRVIDRHIPRTAFRNLPEIAKEFVHHYAYLSVRGWILPGDNARFINHSDDHPNISSTEPPFASDYAARDIEQGEELTIDYAIFDLVWRQNGR